MGLERTDVHGGYGSDVLSAVHENCTRPDLALKALHLVQTVKQDLNEAVCDVIDLSKEKSKIFFVKALHSRKPCCSKKAWRSRYELVFVNTTLKTFKKTVTHYLSQNVFVLASSSHIQKETYTHHLV